MSDQHEFEDSTYTVDDEGVEWVTWPPGVQMGWVAGSMSPGQTVMVNGHELTAEQKARGWVDVQEDGSVI